MTPVEHLKMTSYSKGYYREQLVKKKLEKEGYQVFRSAGSKGPWDLIAVKDLYIGFIQVTSEKPYGKDYDKYLNPVKNHMRVSKEIWIYQGNNKFDVLEVK